MVSRATYLLVCWIQTQRRGASGDLPWHVALSPHVLVFLFQDLFCSHLLMLPQWRKRQTLLPQFAAFFCRDWDSMLRDIFDSWRNPVSAHLLPGIMKSWRDWSGCSCLRWGVLDLRCTISRASFSRGVTLRKIVILPGGNVFGTIPFLTENCFLGMSCLASSYCEYYLNSLIFYKLFGFRKWLFYCLDFFSAS